MQDFYDYIEEHRARVVEGLQVRYESVTSYLKKIEELLEGRMTGSSETMAAYYNYWERRIFNAIATMLIRGMLAHCLVSLCGFFNKQIHISPLHNNNLL